MTSSLSDEIVDDLNEWKNKKRYLRKWRKIQKNVSRHDNQHNGIQPNDAIFLNVMVLSVIMLSVVMLNGNMLNVIMLRVIMLNVIILNSL
jgi:hypothetical protein